VYVWTDTSSFVPTFNYVTAFASVLECFEATTNIIYYGFHGELWRFYVVIFWVITPGCGKMDY